MPSIDFSKVKTQPKIPEGWHKAFISKAESGLVSAAGNKKTNLVWKLADSEGEFAGRTVLDNLMEEPTNDGFFRTLLVLQAIGLIPADVDTNDPDQLRELDDLEWGDDDLVGAVADIKIAYKEYEGRENPRVVGVRPPKASMESALS